MTYEIKSGVSKIAFEFNVNRYNKDGHMKLSDFGLCKPVDQKLLNTLPEIIEVGALRLTHSA